MKKHIAALLLVAAILVPSISARASEDAVPAEKADAIKALLMKDGYDVRQVKMEDGKFEAYVLKDGVKSEVYLDADLKVIEAKSAD
jgi:Peptidase propeptide and YPEB domain